MEGWCQAQGVCDPPSRGNCGNPTTAHLLAPVTLPSSGKLYLPCLPLGVGGWVDKNPRSPMRVVQTLVRHSFGHIAYHSLIKLNSALSTSFYQIWCICNQSRCDHILITLVWLWSYNSLVNTGRTVMQYSHFIMHFISQAQTTLAKLY